MWGSAFYTPGKTKCSQGNDQRVSRAGDPHCLPGTQHHHFQFPNTTQVPPLWAPHLVSLSLSWSPHLSTHKTYDMNLGSNSLSAIFILFWPVCGQQALLGVEDVASVFPGSFPEPRRWNSLCIHPLMPFFHKHLSSTHSRLALILGTRLTEMNEKLWALSLRTLGLVRESAMWARNDHTVQSMCEKSTSRGSSWRARRIGQPRRERQWDCVPKVAQ